MATLLSMSLPLVVDRLEPRHLLAGVTLVTHGFQSNGVFPQWVDRMAEAVDRRVEPWSSNLWTDASLYRMVMTQNGGNVSVQSFTRAAGPVPGSSRTGEMVIALDWASISGLSGPSVTNVAAAVANQILASGADVGFGNGLASVPMHLIGHSRGGVLVAELARAIGQRGIWVDQLSPLDAYPISQDPSVAVTDNVVYADNYYETTDFIVHGSSLAGAHNVGPLNLPGGSSLAHSDVHTYYHGTIGRAAIGDGDVSINDAWYNNSPLTRSTLGYDWSRISGAARPADGTSSLAGGAAARVHVDPTGATWPNVGSIAISGGANGAFATGESVNFGFRYQSQTNAGEVDFYLDSDTNIFNGFARAIATSGAVPSTGALPNTATGAASFNWTSAGLTSGRYYIEALITDGSHVRHVTLTQPIFVTTSGMELATKRWADDTANHDWTDPRNWSPGAPPASTDRAVVDFGTTNIGSTVAVRAIDLSDTANFTSSATQRVDALNTAGSSRFTLSAGANKVLVTKSLSIAGSSNVDLTDNDMIVDYTSASPLNAVTTLISAARNAGAWNGPGLTSTTAKNAVPAITTLGAIEASQFPGGNTFANEPIDNSAVLVKYTYYGDTDFNGKVDGADYARIDTSFNNESTQGSIGGWFNGDLDGNGKVDGADYALIDAAFNSQGLSLRPIFGNNGLGSRGHTQR